MPYRDREAELQIFIPHIDDFLNEQSVLHKIIVLNQTDTLRFNRASLINVGWYEADRVIIFVNYTLSPYIYIYIIIIPFFFVLLCSTKNIFICI